MSQEIYQLYQQLKPQLEVLDKERLLTIDQAKRAVITGLVIGAAVALLVMLLGRSGVTVVIGIVLLAVAGLAGWGIGNERIGRYKKTIKQQIISKLVTLYGQEIRYAPQAGILAHEFGESKLFKTHPDRYHSEDLLEGVLGETSFRCSEVHAEERRTRKDSKGKTETTYVDIFRGIFFIADFNKDFFGDTYVLPDSTRTKAGGLLQGIQRIGGSITGRGQLVMLEDPEFERYFVVYSDNQTTARYLLSTSLMARLVDFRQKHSASLSIAFSKGKITVAIPTTRNLLEPSVRQSLVSMASLKDYTDDLELMLGVVEDLNLNNRIWLNS